MMNELKLDELLNKINPSLLTYQEWINVGMALKHEGYTANIWESWSATDDRHKKGECYQKWSGFGRDNGNIVTGGTVYQYALDQGWQPEVHGGRELAFDDTISDELIVVNPHWLEVQEVEEPDIWDPVKQITTYLSLLFNSDENVGYVTDTYLDKEKGRYLPKKGSYDRTAGELIDLLGKCKGDITNVFGSIKDEAGAWIRFNPLDGQGIKDSNVTDYRFALVESDSVEIEKQNAILRELELPIACLVHSGNKSLHAIVHIDANNFDEYRKRVDYLYQVCEKNGLTIDKQNRNPSRLSRMPGITRGDHKQYIIDTNIGKKSWMEWEDWIEGVNDDLPEPEGLVEVWDNLPELAPELISGVLRQGHKLLLAGPSKAGKSFALIELCIAIAEGKNWLRNDWNCAKGKVLYVNLELDRASCLHRFKDVYKGLGLQPNNIKNIDIWNLRGKSMPMDKLAPKLIRRSLKKGYIAVVIDPIYKVITGDENSASDMAIFTNQFDKVCNELGTAVIICHHHSKGYQGSKRSMDRASGSGVFARDPDALLDLAELELTETARAKLIDDERTKYAIELLQREKPDYFKSKVVAKDMDSWMSMEYHLKKNYGQYEMADIRERIKDMDYIVDGRSYWRVEGTLREFKTFHPINICFDYPIHVEDEKGYLEDLMVEADKQPWQKAMETRKTPEKRKEERVNELEIAFANLEMENENEPVTKDDLAEEMGISVRTVDRRIKEHGGFEILGGGIGQGNKSEVKRKV